MQNEPFMDWQRLTEVYSKMYDGELLELAADAVDLTEMAKQVLRDEMRKRGLDDPRAVSTGAVRRDPLTNFGTEPTGSEIDDQETDLPHEYTWKTPLCECDTTEQAWQIDEVLRRAGIESWIEGAGVQYAVITRPRVVVAADQLDAGARDCRAAHPAGLIEESRDDVEEYEPPMSALRRGRPGAGECRTRPTVALRSVRKQWTEAAAGRMDAVQGQVREPQKRKEPPGNRAALSSGRIVPTEAKPSELSGCIVGAGEGSVKDKSEEK